MFAIFLIPSAMSFFGAAIVVLVLRKFLGVSWAISLVVGGILFIAADCALLLWIPPPDF
jgi:hypothetical protein